MSKYDCPLNFEASAKLCYHESCCFDCKFCENDGDTYPCKVCAAIGGSECKYTERECDQEYWPQPHERC